MGLLGYKKRHIFEINNKKKSSCLLNYPYLTPYETRHRNRQPLNINLDLSCLLLTNILNRYDRLDK